MPRTTGVHGTSSSNLKTNSLFPSKKRSGSTSTVWLVVDIARAPTAHHVVLNDDGFRFFGLPPPFVSAAATSCRRLASGDWTCMSKIGAWVVGGCAPVCVCVPCGVRWPRFHAPLGHSRLYNEFIWMNVTLSNATIGRMWLLQMGNAAQNNGINIQYCMPYPRHAMQRCVACMCLKTMVVSRTACITHLSLAVAATTLCVSSVVSKSRRSRRFECPKTTSQAPCINNGRLARRPSSRMRWDSLPSRTTFGPPRLSLAIRTTQRNCTRSWSRLLPR